MKGKLTILGEFWSFLRVRKKWWLAPIVILLLTLGLILVVTEGSAIAPLSIVCFKTFLKRASAASATNTL